MNYLLESTVCITIFYGLYYLIFRRLTFVRLNRIYLLSSLVIGLSLPLISYQIKEVVKIPASVEYEETTTSMPLVINSSTPLISNTPIEEPFDWNMILQGIYVLGILFMTFKLIYSFKNIFKLIIKNKSYKSLNPTNPNSDGVASDNFYISTQSQYANSSFFNLIFIDDANLTESEINQILEHEKWHIRLFHSYDLLFVEILKIIFWFNPILWLYQRSLSEVHEYEVDTRMIQAYNPQTYAQLLLKLATSSPQLATTHQFSRKPLTDRIHFLFTKQKSVPMKRLAYLSVLPILGAFFMAFSVEKVVDYQEVEESSKYFKIVRGEKMNIKSNDMSKLALMGLKKDEITFFIGFDRLSKESIEDARGYFKDYGFTLNIVNSQSNKNGKLINIELSLLEDDVKNKQIGRERNYDMYNDGGRFDLEEFKKMSKKDKGFCLSIHANKKTGHHSVALADIALTPPPPPKAPPAPPKPPLPPVKVGVIKKNETDKVGEVIINNERFFYATDKKGVTTIYNRFGVQVNEQGKALTLKDIPKVGMINSKSSRNVSLTGLVVDSETLLPLNNAEFFNDDEQLLGKTNANGFYDINFDVNNEGEIRFKLSVKKDGYAKFVQNEHWGDLHNNLNASFYFGLGKKWTKAKPFSELVTDNKYTTYEEIQKRFSPVKDELNFEKKIENAKKNNAFVVHKIDNDFYLINNSGWIKLNSADDKIIVNNDKIFTAKEINSYISRSCVTGMSPIISKNASFEVQDKCLPSKSSVKVGMRNPEKSTSIVPIYTDNEVNKRVNRYMLPSNNNKLIFEGKMIGKGKFLSEEVTQKDWQIFLEYINHDSYFSHKYREEMKPEYWNELKVKSEKIPVTFVSWSQGVEYCKWQSQMFNFKDLKNPNHKTIIALNGKVKLPYKFRLPTESEWETLVKKKMISSNSSEIGFRYILETPSS